MHERTLGILESIIETAEAGDEIDVDELRDVVDDLETRHKYATASYAMYCTNEDILVIYNKGTGEFMEIDVPMEGTERPTVTRVV